MRQIIKFPSFTEGAIVTSNEDNSDETAIILFFKEREVTFSYPGINYNSFYWNNCWDCLYRRRNKCPGGVKVLEKGHCRINVNRELIYHTRKIPSHIWVLEDRDYYMFTPCGDNVIPFCIGNVYIDSGKFCLGQISFSYDLIDMYDSFFNSTRNLDLNTTFVKEDTLYLPDLKELIENWEINNLYLSSESGDYYNPDELSYVSELDLMEKFEKDNTYVLDVNKTYFISDEHKDSKNYICLIDGFYFGENKND